ncbi:diaminopimelate decarboxylase [bacterium]|nr:diaminopimelate decarboxylase [bacterium]
MAWWENEFLKIRGGKLFLGEEEASKVAEKWGTPLFVYSQKQILSNFYHLRNLCRNLPHPDIRIYYAMKANPNRKILKILREAGAGIDAVSPGEVEEALKSGFPGRKIFFTGTSVSPDDLRSVFTQDGLIVNIDAEQQLELMKEIREREFKGKKIKVSIRWNPGIGRGFNPKVVTAGKRSPDGKPIKFGVEEKRVIHVLEKAAKYGFEPVGLHQHLGSGWLKEDWETVKNAVDKMVQKASEIHKKGFELEFLDFGGGFGPKYAEEHQVFPLKKYIDYIFQKVDRSDLHLKAVALEPGKYLVGSAGVLLFRVEYLKRNYGNLFACVNAGTFNTVPRPAIYTQAQHPIIHCSKVDSGDKVTITIAGNLCESGDIFGQEIFLPHPKRGDILALLCAGAYSRSMASTFNLRKRPKEIII